MRINITIAAMLATAFVIGCASNDPERGAKTGTVVGAITGAVIGNQAGGDNKARVIGAALGGIAGFSIGRYMDKQQQEIETALADELAAQEIKLQRMENDVLRVSLSSEASFDVGEYKLKPPFYNSLNKISEVLGEYDQTLLDVIGHTDSTGSEEYNQKLSEQRSKSVAKYLVNKGVQSARINYEGRGELDPITDNTKAETRRINRRVEIEIIPVAKQEG